MKVRLPKSSVPVLLCLAVVWSCSEEPEQLITDTDADFLAFSIDGQTLPESIHTDNNKIFIEVGRDANIKSLAPEFDVPEGFRVLVDGKEQQSGVTAVDFSKPVVYDLKNVSTGAVTLWEVNVEPLSCKVLVDASHDGGVWWFPQGPQTGYDQNKPHQGMAFANLLRQKGFEVDELGRHAEITEEMFFGYYIVIRATGSQPYSQKELNVYAKLLERGMNLVLFQDHMRNNPADELGDFIGVKFQGSVKGWMSKFTPHDLTNGMTKMYYLAGAVVMNEEENPNIEVLGRLGPSDLFVLDPVVGLDPADPKGLAVMGVVKHPTSRIFFMGDLNAPEISPDVFVNNLVAWMGKCP